MPRIDIESLFESVKEERSLLIETGAGGHCMHPYEDPDMKASELKELMTDLFKGRLDMFEKIDGINLLASFRNGKAVFARNKSDISRYSSRDSFLASIDNAYLVDVLTDATDELEQMFASLPEGDRQAFLMNGRAFVSFEIVDSRLRNMIEYAGRPFIQVNGFIYFDKGGNKTGENFKNVDRFTELLNKFGTKGAYSVSAPEKITCDTYKTAWLAGEFCKRLDDMGIEDSDKISNLDEDKFDELRYVFVNIGSRFLKRCAGFKKSDAASLWSRFVDFCLKNDVQNSPLPARMMSRFKREIRTIGALSSGDCPETEGVVFKYKGKTYKLTGMFAPMNQILGMEKYRG